MKHKRAHLVAWSCVVAALNITFPLRVQAEAPYNIAWLEQIGTGTRDGSDSVAVDALGNAYISGHTFGSLGGPSAGGYDAFLIKYDSAGSVLWSRQIGTVRDDFSESVAVDALGNAYISGHTWGSLGGPNAGSNDAFLTKYDSAGSVLWSRQIGTSEVDLSYSVAVDGLGNAYISGYTDGSLGGPNAGSNDAFLIKYDSAGSVLWSRQIGTSHVDDYSYSVAVDGLGNAYISGDTSGSLGGPQAGDGDAFLTKYDSAGSVLWSRQIGARGSDVSHSVAVDALGNAYISGRTSGSLGGPNAGSDDAFFTKYDPTGSVLWSRQIGTPNTDDSLSVAVDGVGNIYLSGYTFGSLGGPQAGDGDAFLAKYDASGSLLWSSQIGTSDTDASQSLVIDAAGNAYISGYTYGSLGGPNAGEVDAFLVKFSPVPAPPSYVLGDMDGDGDRDNFDIDDFELALTNPAAYLIAHPTLTNFRDRGDIEGDDDFDNFDIQPFEALLTGGPSGAAVPEPSALLLAGVGLITFAGGRFARRSKHLRRPMV